jgi:hypothetical protein
MSDVVAVLPTEREEWSVSTPASALARLLEEAERATVLRPEPPQHPTPATRRAPRPFAYD